MGDGAAFERLIAQRDAYEAIFAGLLEALPLAPEVDRHSVRLMLLGALNWTHTWYRPGAQPPEAIARDFLHTLRTGLERPAQRPASGAARARRGAGTP